MRTLESLTNWELVVEFEDAVSSRAAFGMMAANGMRDTRSFLDKRDMHARDAERIRAEILRRLNP